MEGFVEWTFEGDLKRSRSHGFRYAEAINAGNIFLINFIRQTVLTKQKEMVSALHL
jgi:hypothetical protein